MQSVVRIFLMICAFVGAPASALSAESWEVLFDKEFLADLESGTRLIYDQTDGKESNDATSLQVLISEERKAELTLVSNQRERKIGNFSSEVGNPIVLYFLEEVVRNMSKQTNGSPFYIRNRIMESIQGSEIKETLPSEPAGNGFEMRILPFATDENKIKMGNFGELSIVATVSDNIPGGILSLQAITPAQDSDQTSYNNSIKFRVTGE